MPYSRANGADIWFETKGDGPALVLIHANPFDHDLWLYQAAHFSTWFKVVGHRHPRLWPIGEDDPALLAQGHVRRCGRRDEGSRHRARDRHGVQRRIGHRDRLGPGPSREVRGAHPGRRQQRRERPLHETDRGLPREPRGLSHQAYARTGGAGFRRDAARPSPAWTVRRTRTAVEAAMPSRKCSGRATAPTAHRAFPR